MNNAADVLWVLLRSPTRDIPCFPVHISTDQHVPFWTGYNSSLSNFKSEFTVVSYDPIIDSKPSDMSTVYTTMKKCSDMTKSLNQTYSVQTFDQQLYAIAKQVEWSKPDVFKTHILRLGGFHTLSCFIASIGKLWGDGGLRDLLIDSSVYAAGTVDQMLAGKQFNRDVRGLMLAYEALSVQRLSSFFRWCEANEFTAIFSTELCSLVQEVSSKFHEDQNLQTNIAKAIDFLQVLLLPHFKTFIQEACALSKTFNYWNMFLCAVDILLQNVRAEREGNWELHLSSVSAMLPYFFVTNRVNYSRWLPVYLLDMFHLPHEIKSAFEAGQFAIRQKSSKFNGIWSDMATEKTVIRDSKGTGGIVGITRQKSSLLRWSLTRQVLADVCSEMKSRSGTCMSEDMSHEETRKKALKRDEEHVNLLIEHICHNMTDPFDTEEHPNVLINISTGMHASKEVETSLISAIDNGAKMAKTFIDQTLNEGGSGNFFNPITRSKIKTFEEMTKKTKLKCRLGEVMDVHINPELVFRRALILASSRDDVTVEKLISFPVGPIPTSLFHDDGTMRKSCKADICHQLESEVSTRNSLEPFNRSSTVLIRDGMALVQALNIKKARTFGDLMLTLIRLQKTCFTTASTVIDVFDRYDVPLSIKSCERERRCQSMQTNNVFQIIEGRPIPDWKTFLSVVQNKQALLRFIGEYISQYHSQLFASISEIDELYLTGVFSDPMVVKKVCVTGLVDCKDLYCSHEEADTRMIFHLTQTDKTFGQKAIKGRIIIRSPDTDVLVLCVHFFPSLKHTDELWFQTGTFTCLKDNQRFIPVHELCQILNPVFIKILPAAYALTGCDTTSSMFSIGKKTVYKILKENPEEYKDLHLLATCDLEKYLPTCRKFVAKLYDQRRKHASAHSDLNQLRVRIATRKNATLARLPPCEATFEQHVLRASLQTYIWTSLQSSHPPFKSPLMFGWEENGGLTPILFKGQMSSDFLQDLVCTCKGKSVCGSNCVFFEQNLACTDLCHCQGSDICKNVNTNQKDNLDEDDNGL